MNQWDQFLTPYKQAVDELKVKLKGMRKQYEVGEQASPIEFVTGRVKPIASIIDKANKRQIPFDRLREEMYDIAGLRMMCQFVEDIDVVVNILRQRKDFKVIEERDYIRNTKESGYRSYHVIIEYPIETLQGQKFILAEIQIRTLAMNFWQRLNILYDINMMVLIRMKFNIVWKERQKQRIYLMKRCLKLKMKFRKLKNITRKNVLKNMKMINEVL